MSESESKPIATAEGGGSSTKSAAEPSTSITPPPPATSTSTAEENAVEDDMLLVTEFPPPPYYYTLASRQTPSHLRLTSPPEIPHRAFKVAAKRVHLERQKAREESERIRLEAEEEGQQQDSNITTTAGGKAGTSSSEATGGGGAESPHQKADIENKEQKQSTSTSTTSADDDDDDSIDLNNPNEPVVAVFGEIVEDPTLVVEEECHDPIEIRDNVKRLNQSVLKGFWMLVQKLVHDPNDNKKLRDELSHNLFRMLQECNKFREHQAREILIETLEEQLERRRAGLDLLKCQIGEADDALVTLQTFRKG